MKGSVSSDRNSNQQVTAMAQDEAYRRAEKKIEEALQSGAKELHLSGMSLTELPESLFQLTELESLNLCRNRLFQLPEWLGQFANLQKLNLFFNELRALPESFGQLIRLRTLCLSDNRLTAVPESLFKLTQLNFLLLSDNKLVDLPESLSHLTQLQVLDLAANRLSHLPESLGELTQLQSLYLCNNRLMALPESLGQLKNLEELDLSMNGLIQLPPALSRLVSLKRFSFSSNRITIFPHWLSTLDHLEELYALQNNIESIPESVGRFARLKRLILGGRQVSWSVRYDSGDNGNKLKSLPACVADLGELQKLQLDGNPLNPGLAAAYKDGIVAVKCYLRELAKAGRSRYEAKLLILGDGNEGKTCVSRALRGLKFQVQKTTRGVDVVHWKFAHPDDAMNREKEITLNIWDFEGQEIAHQSHQFFLTSEALYLLVFKCRDQFLMDRAEYWLDTIRARAPKAKVAIVITQCEARSPHIPLDRIQSQYSDLLAKEWFFPVGCKDGKKIEDLREFLRRSAADLEFMGSAWPQSYEDAETKINARAKNKAHIGRAELDSILCQAKVSEDNYDGAASALARIGAITQFPDCPDLRDFVVLKPQWLTKAISKLMEDDHLSNDKGEITFKRMEGIWNKASYNGMFATFHNCMKQFELCYDLEDYTKCCLVPLRFGYVAPPIPWTDGSDLKARRIEYKLNIRPPMGIMSRFIVKTHHMIVKTPEYPKGIYWHNGVFLRSNSPAPSEALCEFVEDKGIIRVQVRAAFPQNMCEQVHAYLQAVFSFFEGLSAERSYGCIKVESHSGGEAQCKGLHTEKRIYTAISKKRETLDCEFEEHEVDPRVLVYGFGSFGDFLSERIAATLRPVVRQEMDRTPDWAVPFMRDVGTLIDWVHTNSDKLDQLLRAQADLPAEFKQQVELKFHEYLACVSDMLDDREHTAAPGLISVTIKDGSPWNPATYFKQTYVLTPYCECDGNIHACPDGSVTFTKDKAWWAKTAPWIARSMKLLSAGLQLGFAGMPLALGEATKAIENEVKFMDKLAGHMKLEVPKSQENELADTLLDATFGKDLRGTDREAAITRVALARFLEETAPDNYRAKRWGSLSRVRMSDNRYRWLCATCAKRK
jgi:internalin A